MDWLAFDIGGANLKAATGTGYAAHRAFALWREPKRLAAELRTMIAEAPACDRLVVTMTGELADCFETRTHGVRFILHAVHDAADGRHTRVYRLDGRLVAPPAAAGEPLDVAAANWHALATFSGRYVPQGRTLLFDVGSTTSDLVPLRDGRVVASGNTDTQRLISGELVYAGVSRTPVCGLVHHAPYRQHDCPVMLELFATTKDVYLLTGEIDEDPADTHTADRRPATKRAARLRLSRMLGADATHFNMRDAVRIAQHVAQAQVARLAKAVRRVAEQNGGVPDCVVLSGEGEFLARRVLAALEWSPKLISLAQQLGPSVSKCAPAHALAVLARESTAELDTFPPHVR